MINVISKTKRMLLRHNGYTLIEVIIGMSIFLIIIVPLLVSTSKFAFNTKSRDLQTAYSLLKGESDIIYKNNVLPPAERKVKVGVRTYTVYCDHTKDSVLTTWKLRVEKKNKVIAKIKGLAYIPD